VMFAIVDGRKQHALPEQRAQCPNCDGTVVAKCGEIRVWHWAHEAVDCDPWAEGESEWHLGWKKHADVDHTEVVVEKDGKRHRADVLCRNSAVLELQAGAISFDEIRAREDFYKYMAWLFRVSWADRLHYGKKGFWWKGGHVAQTHATKPLFWDFEEEGIVQEVKLALTENNRVVGRAVKTYKREQFAEFIATGKVSS
jgi:competence CoiA-like predicted nuclease